MKKCISILLGIMLLIGTLPVFAADAKDFEPFKLNVTRIGQSKDRKFIRLVIDPSNFPFPYAADVCVGMKMTGTITSQVSKTAYPVDTKVTACEANKVLEIPMIEELSKNENIPGDYLYDLTLAPDDGSAPVPTAAPSATPSPTPVRTPTPTPTATPTPTIPSDAGPRPADEIAVLLNNSYMKFDVAPIMLNDRTLVPFRVIFEALGCTVTWDDVQQTAIGERGGELIKLPVGNQLAKVDGEAIYLDQPAVVKDDRTLVPLRFVAESLGADVYWEESSQTVIISAEIKGEQNVFLFTPASFTDVGTWGFEGGNGNSFPGGALKGGTEEKPETALPAVAKFSTKVAGEYKIWVRSRDYPNDRPGIRFFNVEVNGVDTGNKYGTHGKEGYAWVDGGTVTLVAGENTVSLVDSANFYGRCDAILITNDMSYTPSDNYEEILTVASPTDAGSGFVDVTFPAYAKDQAAPSAQAAIENDTTKVTFFTVPTENGNVIQNEISVKQNGAWTVTKSRAEDFGYLLVAADTAKKAPSIEEASAFNTAYMFSGKQKGYYGTNVYGAGNVSWMIPTEVSVSGNSAVLTFSNELVDFQAVWTLEAGQKSPVVEVKASYKNAGVYSIGAFEGSELPIDGIETANAQGFLNGKDIRPDPGIVLGNGILSAPSAVFTTTSGINKGIAADASKLPASWGFALRGPDCNYRSTLFAPILGGDGSAVDAGGSQSFQYQVVSDVAE